MVVYYGVIATIGMRGRGWVACIKRPWCGGLWEQDDKENLFNILLAKHAKAN